MIQEFNLQAEFGSFCADGEKAAKYFSFQVLPTLFSAEKLVFDFRGIRNMNSSFANALFANIASQDPSVLNRIEFRNSSPIVKTLVQTALQLGLEKHRH